MTAVNTVRMGSPIATAELVLTNDQILASPGTLIEIVPPTEVLNYKGSPRTLPVPVLGVASLDSSHGAYTNIDASFAVALWWGNGDASVISLTGLGSQFGEGILYDFILQTVTSGLAPDGNLQDNGLYFQFYNGGSGNFTGGNASNTATVRINYFIMLI